MDRPVWGGGCRQSFGLVGWRRQCWQGDCLRIGVKDIHIDDILAERTRQLADELSTAFVGLTVRCGRPVDSYVVDIAINATPCGTEPDDVLPFDPTELRSDSWVADTLRMPEITHLLFEA